MDLNTHFLWLFLLILLHWTNCNSHTDSHLNSGCLIYLLVFLLSAQTVLSFYNCRHYYDIAWSDISCHVCEGFGPHELIWAACAVACLCLYWVFNTLRPRQNVHRFVDDTIKRIFLNKNVRISIRISLKFVPKGPINPSLVQIMVWRQSGDKPLSEPMMVSLLTHICVTPPQWVKID